MNSKRYGNKAVYDKEKISKPYAVACFFILRFVWESTIRKKLKTVAITGKYVIINILIYLPAAKVKGLKSRCVKVKKGEWELSCKTTFRKAKIMASCPIATTTMIDGNSVTILWALHESKYHHRRYELLASPKLRKTIWRGRTIIDKALKSEIFTLPTKEGRSSVKLLVFDVYGCEVDWKQEAAKFVFNVMVEKQSAWNIRRSTYISVEIITRVYWKMNTEAELVLAPAYEEVDMERLVRGLSWRRHWKIRYKADALTIFIKRFGNGVDIVIRPWRPSTVRNCKSGYDWRHSLIGSFLIGKKNSNESQILFSCGFLQKMKATAIKDKLLFGS